MELRRCGRCEQEKPLSEFHRDRKARAGRTYLCKPCNSARVKEWVAANPERARKNARARQARWRARNPETDKRLNRKMRERGRAFIDAQKQGKPCTICGGSFPAPAMDWHHRDPLSKIFTIGRCTSYSPRILAAEIAKCDLICANCHRVMSAA